MKRILLFTLILSSNLASGQEWLALYQESQKDYENNAPESAYEKASRALSLYEGEFGKDNSNYCSILRHLSILSYTLGNLQQGITYEKEEIGILRTLDNRDKNTLAGALSNLALFYQTLGEGIAAEPLLEEVVSIYSESGENTEELYLAHGMLAVSQFAQQKMDEAGNNFMTSVEFFSSSDELPYDYLTILLNYGLYLIAKDDYENALKRISEARDYYEQFGLIGGPEFLVLLRNLGSAKTQSGDLEGAGSDLKQALDLAIELYGENDSETTLIKNELALVYEKQGKTDLADALSTNADVSNLDEESRLDYAITQSNQGAIRQTEGDLQKAEKLYLEAINIFETLQKEPGSYLITLQNLGRLYQGQGQLQNALNYFQKAQSVASNVYGESSHYYAESLVNIADLNRIAGKPSETNLYLAALEIFESDPNTGPEEKAKAYEGLALLYLGLGNFEKSQENFLLAINSYASASSKTRLLNTKSNYAVLKQAMGEYANAEALLRDIYEEVISEGKGTLGEAIAAENLGSILIEQAKYREAQEFFESALKIREGYGKTTPEYAAGLINLARLRVREGKYTQAEPLYKSAKAIYAETFGEEDIRLANIENNMAIMYQYMGNMAAAESLLAESAEKIRKNLGPDHREYATALENQASLLEKLGRTDEALPLLMEALQIDEKTVGKNHPAYAFTLHNLASFYLNRHDYQKAEELFLQSVKIESDVLGEAHPIYAGTLNNLGVLYEKLGNYTQAESYFRQALGIREKVLGAEHPEYAYSQYGLAVLYLKMGKLSEAKVLYESVITNYLNQVQEFFPALSENEKSDFYTKIKPIIENFKEFTIEYAVNQERNLASEVIGEIYNVQLSTKALLLNATNKVRDRITASGDSELINLFNSWVQIKENLARYYQYSLDQLKAEQVDVAKLESQANQIEKDISLRSQIFAREFDKQPVTWEQVRDKLSEKEAAIEILRVQRNAIADTVMYVGLVLKRQSKFPKMVILNYGEALEKMMYKFYKNSVAFRMQDANSYNAFWKDLDGELNGIDRIYVSADGIFNKINLNTLLNPETKEYLLGKYEIILLSNTRELLEENTPTGNQNATLLGYVQYQGTHRAERNPQGVFRTLGEGGWLKNGIPMLDGTRAEIENIAAQLETFGWKYETLREQRATEAAVKNLKGQNLIHIATHGFFLEDLNIDESGDGFGSHVKNYEINPLFRSGILLSGSGETIFGAQQANQPEDGILTAYEAMNLSLDGTDLVVLSACETGLGEIRNGEGVYGLQRALLVAGARGLLMSLWKVNDETTQKLMTYFYQNWLSGMPKLEAFKHAQLSLKDEFKEPYYWGAFILIGR